MSLVVTSRNGGTGGSGGSGVNGSVFITNVEPANLGDNVSNKVFSSDGVVLDSFATTTYDVIVYILALPGDTNYKPVVTVNGDLVTNLVEGSDKPVFTGSITITLNGTSPIIALHEDGAQHSCSYTSIPEPEILSAEFTGGYPAGQTELKENDTFDLVITADANIVEVQLDNYGAYKPQTFTVSANTVQTITGTIADRGNSVQSLAAKVRIKDQNGTLSGWFYTDEFDSVDGVNVVNLNNLYPSISIVDIAYPEGQQALKDNESAYIENSVSNYNTISYTSNGELTITNNTSYEIIKQVSRLSGNYNISTNNFTITAIRTANGAETTNSTVVQIAHVAAQIQITEPTVRLDSSPTGKDHLVTMVSNQELQATPSLAEDEGTFQGSWTPVTSTNWGRYIRIFDSNPRGVYNWTALSATNLAGIETTIITGNDTYEIGGFSERDIYFSPFQNEAPLGVSVSDPTKLVALDKDLITMTYVGNDFSDATRTFTITEPTNVFNANGNILHWNDVLEVDNNATGLSFIRIRENA